MAVADDVELDACPFCLGEIPTEATVCRHCGAYERVDGWVPAHHEADEAGRLRRRVLTIVAVVVLLVVVATFVGTYDAVSGRG